MSGIKWFSGGKERKTDALEIMDSLIAELDGSASSLQKVLMSYRDELKDGGISTPLVLSRMNIAVSNAMLENGIQLPPDQSKKLKQLRDLSKIRYGY